MISPSFADVSLAFDPAPPWSAHRLGPWMLGGVVLAIVVATIATYRGSTVPVRRRVAVIIFRLLALFIALLTIVRPTLVFREDDKLPSTLLLAFDASRSMTVADEAAGKTRWQRLEAIRKQCESALNTLHDEHNVKIETHFFADDVSDRSADPPDGSRSDFGQMLRSLSQRYGQERSFRGLIVVSDGADNGTRVPAIGEASRFRALNCPIHTFALGRQNTAPTQKDVAITAVVAEPAPVPVKGKLTVRTTIDCPGYENARVVVRLLFDGKEVAAKDVVLPKQAGNEVLLETTAPATPGEIKLSVKVDPLPGETTLNNNEYRTYLTVSKEGLSVLVIDRLRFELKFVRRALAGDPRIRVFEAIRQTDDPPRGSDASLYDFDKQAYDVIVIGDVSARRLAGGDGNVLTKIESLVRDKGVGLLMTGGADAFANGGWKGTVISDLLPVFMDASGQAEELTKMVPTPEQRGDYLMKLTSDPTASEQLWRSLPALPGYTRMGRRKDGAVVLGQTNTGTPLFVRQTYGKGRTAALALDMTYLWQQLGQTARPRTTEGIELHSRFWRQLMLYLAQQEEFEGNVWLKPDVRRVPLGSEVAFGVGVRGKTGLDLADGNYDVQVFGPDDKPVDSPTVSRIKDSDRGKFVKTDRPGEYRILVRGIAKDADGISVSGEAGARFIVYADDTELLRPAADHDFLQRLATAGGGQAMLADDLPKFLEELPKQPRTDGATKSVKLPDWRSTKLGPFQPVLLLLFVLLLGLEWGLRRWWGLV